MRPAPGSPASAPQSRSHPGGPGQPEPGQVEDFQRENVRALPEGAEALQVTVREAGLLLTLGRKTESHSVDQGSQISAGRELSAGPVERDRQSQLWRSGVGPATSTSHTCPGMLVPQLRGPRLASPRLGVGNWRRGWGCASSPCLPLVPHTLWPAWSSFPTAKVPRLPVSTPHGATGDTNIRGRGTTVGPSLSSKGFQENPQQKSNTPHSGSEPEDSRRLGRCLAQGGLEGGAGRH